MPPTSSVCFVLPDGHGLGGVTDWSIEMARRTAERGREAILLEHVNPEVDWRQEIDPLVRYIQCEGRHPAWAQTEDVPGYDTAYARAVPGTLVPNYTEGAYAACANAARSRPSDVRVLGFVHTDQPYYYDLVDHFDPLISLFVAVSDEVAASLAARLPHRVGDIRLQPYGVAVDATLTRSWSTASAPLQLAYAGRLVQEQKRVTNLIPLVRELVDRSVDFRLQIAGSGTAEGELRAGLEALGPKAWSRVEFVGRIAQDRMPDFWRAADAAILVSDYEGTSIAMLEAMAQGCVPIVTRVSGTGATIQDGRSGYVVPVGDMRSMADRIATLARSRARLSEMGQSAHGFVLREHSIRDYLDWFDSLVEEAWRKPPPSWPSSRPLLPPVRCGAPRPRPITFWGRCLRFSGKVRRKLLS